MHGSLGHFKATLQRRKERTESKNKGNFSRKNTYTFEGKLANESLQPKMSAAEFAEFKLKLKSERKKKTTRDWLLLIIVLGVLIALWALVFK